MEEKNSPEDAEKEKKTAEDAGKEDASMMECVISKCQSPFLTVAIGGLVASSMGIEEESINTFNATFTTLTTLNNLLFGYLACKYEEKKLPTEDHETKLPEASN